MGYEPDVLDDAMAQAPIQSEVQTLSATGTVSSGEYKLEFDGQTTANIAYNANIATITTRLEALSNIGAGDVVVSGGGLPTTPVVITFAAALASKNVPLITVEAGDTPLGGGGSYGVVLTTPGYGTEKLAINAGIDVLGELIEDHEAAFSTVEAETFYEHLYKLGDMVGNALKDQLT